MRYTRQEELAAFELQHGTARASCAAERQRMAESMQLIEAQIKVSTIHIPCYVVTSLELKALQASSKQQASQLHSLENETISIEVSA